MPCKYPSVSGVSIDRWESALYDEKPVKTVEITQCSTAEPEEVSTTGAEPPSEAMTHRLCKWIFDLVNKLKYCIRKDSADHDVSGKLIVLRTALIIYSTAYICSLVLNKTTFDGKCMGNVDFGYGTLGHPFHSPLGYNACTQNTKTKIIEPNFHIHQNTEGQQVLVWKENERWHDRISEPGSQSLTVLGAVDTNHIRIYGEWFRIFTGIILHAGWFHLLNNALIHFIVLYIIEPEWGFYRTLLGYFVTGCGSYLAGAVFIPCLRQIGSSGVHFGFIGAIAPYCVENWYRMGSPVIVLSLSLLVPLLDLCIKEADIGIQIHLGGYIFGMLYGFSTIKAVTLFDKGVPYYRFTIKFFSRWLKESTRNLYIRKVVKACQIEEMNRIQYENQAKSSTCGFFFMKRLFGVYPLGPYRMRPRDWVTRGISFCLMVILMTFLILMLCFEPLYSSFNPTVSSAFTQTCICCYIKIRNKSALQRLQVLDLAGKYFCFRSKEYANRYCF